MKTKELIKELQEADPTGEEEVTVGNTEIFTIENSPAYYDGCQQILIRDKKNPYYNVISGKVRSKGNKICINTHSIYDAIFENPQLKIDYSELSFQQKAYIKIDHDAMRKFSKNCNYNARLENFINFIKNRIPCIEKEILEKTSKEFFDRNKSLLINNNLPTYEIKRKDGGRTIPSWNDREHMYWHKNISIHVFNNKIIIEKLNDE